MRPDADLSPRGIARLVAEFLERLDLRDVTLVGGGCRSSFAVETLCPLCGKANSSTQKYCHGCGASLKVEDRQSAATPVASAALSRSARPSDSRYDAIVVGGGVAGAATACAFARAGVGVAMFERRDLARDPNRGDLLHQAAVDHLSAWGAPAGLERHGAFYLERTVFTDAAGSFEIGIDQSVHPLLALNHAEIEAVLTEAATAAGAEVIRETVRETRFDGQRWIVETNAATASARLLVGADGAGSRVRTRAGIEAPRKDYAEAVVILHASRPQWVSSRTYCAVLHPDGPVLVVATTPEGLCRVVIAIRLAHAARWLNAGAGELSRLLGERVPRLAGMDVRSSSTYLYRLAQQHASTYVAEKMALVGDAAHVVHPAGGQGMSLAIQDAAALAEAAGPVLTQDAADDELQKALLSYEGERRPLNAKAMKTAHRAARFARPGRLNYLLAKTTLRALAHLPGGFRVISRRLFGAAETAR